MNSSSITAIILTFNEAKHLQRCIDSVRPLTNDIVVVDSLSTDDTVAIAKQNGAKVLERAWENNHSTQFNWALTQLPAQTQWVLRIDADEILTPELVLELKAALVQINSEIVAIRFQRKMVFQGYLLKHGGMGSNQVLRMFKFGHGKSEARWMDEHIRVDGACINLNGALIDDNLNSLDWWIAKHNNYASREAVDLLNLKYQFMQIDRLEGDAARSGAGLKRKIKEGVYAKLPGGMRASAYFLYRYIVLLGFLDQKTGRQFHYLQALWYRSLVDMKVAEVERYMARNQISATEAIQKVLGIAV
ncbi:glycosyltransferase family 2 protein [Polynucleobacter sp. 15G-AUS-farblos]|uniref:glycosyltransferase family 2 protein n=1 Tax=Polynucleobacter sp. 15G-AUS-farblos TaxID=2689094 RepID=UPI001C0C4EDC|nr:glycosyltransferase family 2 protein [Polynucleobacter sp. 15G-AUS-farblos]MBU3584118.1 glycosyltransferase family 2 protein [Polynucleobacter sp. 15G-AUS-farblos]